MPPNNLPTVHWITHALVCGAERVGKVLIIDFNAYLENKRDQREEKLAPVLAGHGLTDQARHFVPRQRYRTEGNCTWRMWIEGILISGPGDYILGTTQQDFSMLDIREPIMPTNHWMVLGLLTGEGVRGNHRYNK